MIQAARDCRDASQPERWVMPGTHQRHRSKQLNSCKGCQRPPCLRLHRPKIGRKKENFDSTQLSEAKTWATRIQILKVLIGAGLSWGASSSYSVLCTCGGSIQMGATECGYRGSWGLSKPCWLIMLSADHRGRSEGEYAVSWLSSLYEQLRCPQPADWEREKLSQPCSFHKGSVSTEYTVTWQAGRAEHEAHLIWDENTFRRPKRPTLARHVKRALRLLFIFPQGELLSPSIHQQTPALGELLAKCLSSKIYFHLISGKGEEARLCLWMSVELLSSSVEPRSLWTRGGPYWFPWPWLWCPLWPSAPEHDTNDSTCIPRLSGSC